MAPRKRKADASDDAAGPSDAAGGAGAPQQRPSAADRRKEMADLARRRAAHFATWDGDAPAGGAGAPSVHAGGTSARELGPWSSATQLADARDRERERRQQRLLEAARGEGTEAGGAAGGAAVPPLVWTPSRDPSLGPRPRSRVPGLAATALRLVVDLLDDVETLWGLPDVVKNAVAAEACRRRALRDAATLRLFVEHRPAEVVLPDCSFLDADTLVPALLEAATPRLERLDLGMCGRGLGDAEAAELGAKGALTGLRILRLGGAYRLSDAGVAALLRAAPGLTALALPQCSRLEGPAVEALPVAAPHLRRLDLAECRGLGAVAILAAARGLPHLKALILDGIPEVDGAFLIALGAAAPRLTEFSAAACPGVTAAGVAALATAAPGLRRLRLDECAGVDGGAVTAAAASCPALEEVSLARCRGVDDAAVAALAALQSLRSLSLNGLAGLTDAAAVALARGPAAKTLAEVDLSWCRGVSPPALGLLADCCRGLRRLTLWGCAQVDGSAFLTGHSNEGLEIVGRGEAELGTLDPVVRR